MTILKSGGKSLRIDPANPDHHLYNNNGTWWIHYTTWHPKFVGKRLRRSLKTSCLRTARQRRDQILSGETALVPVA